MAADGLCECGCGQRTSIAKHTVKSRGQVKGQPVRFALGHHNGRKPGRPRTASDQWEVEPSGCWRWLGFVNASGYGLRKARKGETEQLAHRRVYVDHGHEIPDGWHLHHRCGNQLCVNPDHLEPMDSSEHSTLTNNKRWSAAA